MKGLNNLRIKNKIILIIVVIGTISSITGNLVNSLYEIQRTRNNLVAETQLNAHLIAEYCILPLEFNYPENAREVLHKLEAMPAIVDGLLFRANDSLFAEYHLTADVNTQMPENLKNEDYFIEDNYLHIKHLVESEKGVVGYIYLRSTFNWKSIIIRQGYISGFLTLLMVLLIVIMAYFFQRGITGPIIKLTDQMKSISKLNHYVPAIGYKGKDEVGELYRVFNLMIHQIETRDNEKKEVLENLKLSEAQYQDLYENAPVMYISVDLETNTVVRYNKTLSIITGYDKNELIGKNIVELYHPDSYEKVQQAISRLKTEGQVANIEFKIIKKDGTVLDISLDSTLEKDESGNTLYSHSAWRDISVQKQAQESEKDALKEAKRLLMLADKSRRMLLSVAEDQKNANEEIRKLNDELELRVAQRTVQLEEANKELEAFVYSVSHDLRAPLRSIMGFSQIISRRYKENLNQEGQQYFGYILEASQNMGNLIEDLLRFSRMPKGSISKELLGLNDLMDNVLQNLNQDILASGATVFVPENLPEIMSDRTLLSQIFTNLIQNAITYHRKEVSPEIDFSVSEEEENWIIKIQDNGIGIPEEHHEKIYNIFQRLHASDEYPGTGIGLSIVKKAVNTLGGKIGLQSKVNVGSIFTISLPKQY